jgi:hypothetical protein
MPAISISKRAVDQAKSGERDMFLWDDQVRGFGLKVTPAGAKVYVVQYRSGTLFDAVEGPTAEEIQPYFAEGLEYGRHAGHILNWILENNASLNMAFEKFAEHKLQQRTQRNRWRAMLPAAPILRIVWARPRDAPAKCQAPPWQGRRGDGHR